MKQIKFLIPILAFLGCQSVSTADDTAAVKVGQKAPDFTLTSADEKSVSLSDFEGKNVVLVFSRAHW